MAVGFDIEAALIALSLRSQLPGIRIIAVVPFDGMQHRFSASQRSIFEQIIDKVDEVITLSTTYSVGVYATRNNFLVDNSTAVITYFTGEKGGTAYTIKRAIKSLLQITNIYNNPQKEFKF